MEEFTKEQKLLMKIRDELCQGNAALLARRIEKDSTYVNRLFYPLGKKGRKGIGLEIMQACTKAFSLPPGYWEGADSAAAPEQQPQPIDLEAHPDLVPVRKVKLRLRGGISGYSVEPEDEDGMPIFFRAEWMRERGYKPDALLALKVRGSSMEPSLFPDDMVVINTADSEPKDGEVFAVNYEGEPVIKRLVREGGEWWLASDNADKTRYPNKRWRDKESFLVGRVVHKQSERI